MSANERKWKISVCIELAPSNSRMDGFQYSNSKHFDSFRSYLLLLWLLSLSFSFSMSEIVSFNCRQLNKCDFDFSSASEWYQIISIVCATRRLSAEQRRWRGRWKGKYLQLTFGSIINDWMDTLTSGRFPLQIHFNLLRLKNKNDFVQKNYETRNELGFGNRAKEEWGSSKETVER